MFEQVSLKCYARARRASTKFVLNVQGRPNPESNAEHSWLTKKISIHKVVWISRNDEPVEVVKAALTIRSETDLTIYFSGTILWLRCSLY